MKYEYFKAKMNSVMTDNLAKRLVGGKKSGKIYYPELYKALTSSRVFSQYEQKSTKQYNVVLCLDISGSMTSYFSSLAEYSAHIVPVLRHFGIWVHIIAFDHRVYNVPIPRSRSVKNLTRHFYNYYCDYGGGGTRFDFPIENIKKLIDTSLPPQDNIVFFMTDGESSCYNDRRTFTVNSDIYFGESTLALIHKIASTTDFDKKNELITALSRVGINHQNPPSRIRGQCYGLLYDLKYALPRTCNLVGIGFGQGTSVPYLFQNYAIIAQIDHFFDLIIKYLSKTIKRQ